MHLRLVRGFLFVSLFVPFFTSLPLISLFLYLLISSFLALFFIYSFPLFFCLSFYFFSIFLAPASKLFHVMWVNKLIYILVFTPSNSVFRGCLVFWCFRVFRGVSGCSSIPGCSGVFRCSWLKYTPKEHYSVMNSENDICTLMPSSDVVLLPCQTKLSN